MTVTVTVVDRVGTALAEFLAARAASLTAISPDLDAAGAAIGDFVGGGKRLRPTFAYWGWRGAGGDPDDDDAVVRAVAALELVHACALIHDDVMDGSATRRGRPSVHEQFALSHSELGLTGRADRFGQAAAILLGDLSLIWADEMLAAAGLPADALARVRPAYDEMRVEVMAGQFLDALAAERSTVTTAQALLVARYKSAKYTVERPLHLGALMHGRDAGLLATYSAYGLPLGEAFQLRDDVLGVYGDPAVTGKPAGDDLREGKRTALIALTLERADPTQTRVVQQLLGRPDLDEAGVAEVCAVIDATGARRRVEALIAERTLAAMDAVSTGGIAPAARAVLCELAMAVTARDT